MRDSAVFSTRNTPPYPHSYSFLQAPDTCLNQQIESAIARFGCELLTAREQDVIQLILRGLPSKVAATKLQIARKTEGVHRRNAYAKLGVRSQSALFRQFLEFLSASWTQLEFSDK